MMPLSVAMPALLAGEQATRDLAAEVASMLQVGDVVLLHGDLGAGKTTFVQGMAAALGAGEHIQSPTFTLVAEHRIDLGILHHLDLYRLTDPDELEGMGYEELIDPVDGITVVEWPERAGAWLPESYILVQFDYVDADHRRVDIRRVG
jgi:tRNA threonylcarbamoyladenosine biosynthesis protein TsaE